MLAPCKKAIKACLRPIYRRLPGTLQKKVLQWRRTLTPPPPLPGPPPIDPLLKHLEESDRLLLAALRMARSPVATPEMGGFRGVAIGNDRLLAPHPLMPFVYLDSRDLRQTPHIVAGSFEPEVQWALGRLVQPGACVLEVGAGQGFHTLSLARLVGPTGKVVVLEHDTTLQAVLRDNVVAHDLGGQVTAERRPLHVLGPTAVSALAPDLVRVDARYDLETVLAVIEAHSQATWLVSLNPATQPRVVERWAQAGMRLWGIAHERFVEMTPGEALEHGGRGRLDVVVGQRGSPNRC